MELSGICSSVKAILFLLPHILSGKLSLSLNISLEVNSIPNIYPLLKGIYLLF